MAKASTFYVAFVLLHEVGHLAYKLDEPLVDHVWCDGTACVDLARDDEDAALENADNWAFAALHVSRKYVVILE
jgi:hypothetical protein